MSQPPRFVITGTDTGIGKTVFAAALTGALDGYYWKPVQSGLDQETDSETVRRLSGLPASRILPEAWCLHTPASPHLAAALDGVRIDVAGLQPPCPPGPLVIEGAGGLLVPLTEEQLYADVFARWRLPTILCARTGLGTINHSLLSLEAMRRRGIPVLGIAYLGAPCEDSEALISKLGQVPRLGRLPHLATLDAESLARVFREHFDVRRLAGAGAG